MAAVIDNFHGHFGWKLFNQMLSSSLVHPVLLTTIENCDRELGLFSEYILYGELGYNTGLEVVEENALAAVA